MIQCAVDRRVFTGISIYSALIVVINILAAVYPAGYPAYDCNPRKVLRVGFTGVRCMYLFFVYNGIVHTFRC